MKSALTCLSRLGVPVLIAVCMLSAPALADWNQGQPYKWVQMPDLSTAGIDVIASRGYILADDFLCNTTGPLTDIHIWGSWYHDQMPFSDPTKVTFVLSIHSDIPKSPTNPYSKPGAVLWYRTFNASEFTVRPYAVGIQEGWLTPPANYEFPADTVCWQYNFRLQDGPTFTQQGTQQSPIVYWLDVKAFPQDAVSRLGWKTTLQHWNDDAVWGNGDEPYTGPWFDLHYPTNHQFSGQSIDLAFVVNGDQQQEDWGDAPDPTYPTLAANNGARHTILAGMYLGAGVDAEANGQPSVGADGDDSNGTDDEDGVVFTSVLAPGATANVDVTASIAGKLDAWIDFNSDGDWADAGEQIFVSQALMAGVNSLSFPVPAGIPTGRKYARFRYSTAGGLSFDGPAPNGEVEDYRVSVFCYKWSRPPDLSPNGIDVNATYPRSSADDFLCTTTGPLTDIHVYGSWYHDIIPVDASGKEDPAMVGFVLSIHKDIPAGPNGYSTPGEVLWSRYFAPGSFEVQAFQRNLQEGWLDPPTLYERLGDTVCWRYDFQLQPNEFIQTGTASNPVVYWLDVQAKPQGVNDARFGWKTSNQHWNDDAVWAAGTGAVALDNGSGTASLPPPCPYDDVDGGMQIIDGLSPGDAIHIDTQIGDTSSASEVPGGSLGGSTQNYNAVMPLDLTGVGSLAGFTRHIPLSVHVLTESAPRTPYSPIQSFDTNMLQLQGQLPPGDPDFDLLRVTAGTAFGMPSPGHTTLTQQPGGNWAVDSFFDITYRIDFVGHTGGPLGGRSGSTTGTFRVQAVGSWNELRYPPNHPQYGQSADQAFDITGDCQQEPQVDWGDAPDPTYPTLGANAGASHVIVPGMMLGALIDGEADGQPNATATGDDIAGVDDEDGVVFSTPLVAGAPASALVTASVPGFLDAWIDFNSDGDWSDPGEQIAMSLPLVAGPNPVAFAVPGWAGAPGVYQTTYSRFRFSSSGGLPFTGPAPDGEVEDYRTTIHPRPVVVTKSKAKCLPVGSYVMIRKDVVTANLGFVNPVGNLWYFEEPDRFAALGVRRWPNDPAAPWAIGDLVSCYGYTVMDGCELMLQELYSWQEGAGSVAPLGQNNRNSGGGPFCNQPGVFDDVSTSKPAFGLNSVAMLVRLWGVCTCYSPGGAAAGDMWIDDGSNLWDGNACGATARAKGVRVRIPAAYAGPSIAVGKYYSITGIMRTCTSPQGLCVRWLWPRSDSDFVRIP